MNDQSPKTSPFVIAASVAVIIFSAVGVAALLGVLPERGAKIEAPPAAAQTEAGKVATETAAPPQTTMTPPTGAAMEKAGKPTVAEEPAAKAQPAARPAQKTAAAKPAVRTAATEEASKKAPTCGNCGVITAIRTVEQAGEGSGLGAIAGAVGGALIGSQIGAGRGKDVATIAGAVGGGYAGHQIEKKVKTTKHYEITVRMDDGSHRTMVQDTEPAYAIGEKVKIIDGAIVRN